MSADRRRRPRIPIAQWMEARLVAEGVEGRGRVLDLNNGGAFIATDLDLDKGAEVQVELYLQGDRKPLPLRALVARRTEAAVGRSQTIPAGLGLVFLATNVMERAFIQRAVLETLKTTLASSRAKTAKSARTKASRAAG